MAQLRVRALLDFNTVVTDSLTPPSKALTSFCFGTTTANIINMKKEKYMHLFKINIIKC